jgi:hypothetical protein
MASPSDLIRLFLQARGCGMGVLRLADEIWPFGRPGFQLKLMKSVIRSPFRILEADIISAFGL